MPIRILPGNIANMIAAGEVVQRPASVVKELVENAVDAGSSNVTVVIQDAGRTLIQVIDDGCGMNPDEAVLCFERHATSKLATAEDLQNIHTFGFRGEALASIAAVAAVTLKTRREEDEVGCEVVISAFNHVSTEEVACPRGCNFAIRDLFYNVPARRKFLKSDNVEFKHIVAEFTKVALTRPDVGFTLTHNGKEIYVLKPAKSLKFRIQDLLGTGAAAEVLDVDASTSIVNIHGYIGRPEGAKKGLGNQYFFVNGRYFRSPYLHKAVMKAYENLIPGDLTPSYYLYLEVPAHTVDVNISPTKSEVKFEEDGIIFQTIYACLKEALAKQSFGDSLDFDRGDAPELPSFSRNFEEFHPVSEPSVKIDESFNPFDSDGFPSEVDTFSGTASYGGGFGGRGSSSSFGTGSPDAGFDVPTPSKANFMGNSAHLSHDEGYGKLFEDRMLPSTSSLVLQGKFILTAVKSGLLVINIRRAKERILFERFLEALSKDAPASQSSLFPEPVQIGVENCLLIEDNQAMLQSLGFDIRLFGSDTVVVNAVPEGYGVQHEGIPVMVDNIIDALKSNTASLSETMTATLAEKFARVGAATDEPMTSPVQAQRLIDTLFGCANAEFTNSGRRTMTIIPMEDIEKKF
ncbi:MAG: DNA mismatch repair endonuclease MutL [Bacteroidales bacterium]|nr:DNA mismatch repair endonuclease MutL [Candidatus Cryptobacteroides caccocaballi]